MVESDFWSLAKKGVLKDNTDKTDNGYNFIPIRKLENILDDLNWSTKQFSHQIFKDGYANLCVAASIELEINYKTEDGSLVTRTFVGACNFSLISLEPNPHFLATAKSECIKNAASDIGEYFGRGMNDEVIPSGKKVEKKAVKSKPDSKIMQQFLEAISKGDERTQIMLSNVYDIKTEEDA